MRLGIGVMGVLAFNLLFGMGCGGASSGGASGASSSERVTPDGLVEVDISGPGHLFLRKDHGIGGYDSIAVAPSFVSYLRTSERIDPDEEEIYLVSMEQAILDAAEAAGVDVVNTVGPCVIKVGGGFVNVDLASSSSAEILGRMTLVIEYQDSKSGQSLLRYYSEQQVEREPEGVSREDHVGASFDRMISEMDPIGTLRAATKTPSPPRQGCKGDLIKAGLPTTDD